MNKKARSKPNTVLLLLTRLLIILASNGLITRIETSCFPRPAHAPNRKCCSGESTESTLRPPTSRCDRVPHGCALCNHTRRFGGSAHTANMLLQLVTDNVQLTTHVGAVCAQRSRSLFRHVCGSAQLGSGRLRTRTANRPSATCALRRKRPTRPPALQHATCAASSCLHTL